MNKFDHNFPYYKDDSDYNTNANSYYKDLARKQKLIKLLAKRIWEYENTLNETLEQIEQRLTDYISQNDALMNERLENWDKRIKEMPEEMRSLFVTWLNDGTLEQIINDDVLGNKADKSFVDTEIERLDIKDENITTQLAQNAKHKANWINILEFPYEANATDGIDDSDIFQKAVDDLHASGGGVLFAPKSLYFFDDVVLLHDDIKILGEGYGLTTFKSKLQPNGSQKIFKNIDQINGNKNIEISKVTMDGNKGTYEGKSSTLDEEQQRIIDIQKSKNITLDIEVKNFVTDWYVQRGENNFPSCVLLRECSEVTIDYFYSTQNEIEGLEIIDCQEVHVKKLIAKDNNNWTSFHARTDIMGGSSKDITIDHLYIDGSNGSLANINGKNIHIENAILKNASRDFLDFGIEGMPEGETSKQISIGTIKCYDLVGKTLTGGQKSAVSFTGDGLQINNLYAEGMEIGLTVDGGSNVQVSSIIAKGLRQLRTDGGYLSNGIYLRNAKDIQISKVDIYDVDDHGLKVQTSKDINFGVVRIRKIEGNTISLIDVDGITFDTLFVDNREVLDYSQDLLLDSPTTPSNRVSIKEAHMQGTTSYAFNLQKTTAISLGKVTGMSKIILSSENESSYVIHSGGDSYNYRNPLQFGTSYLWVDGAGNSRIKRGSHPTNDTDGLLEKTTESLTLGGRPETPIRGERVFDTALGKPIWYNGTNWVDALGTSV